MRCGGSLLWFLLICLCSCEGRGQKEEGETALQDYEFGGDFTLTDHRNQSFALQDLRGEVGLLFFGYTFCPDICPVTLSKLAGVGEFLGPERPLKVLFVSVDPQRDTPQQLAAYLDHFDSGVIGLTGSVDEVQGVVKKYAGSYQKEEVDEAGGYLMSHPARTYLIDRQGRVRYLFSQQDTPRQMAAIAAGLF